MNKHTTVGYRVQVTLGVDNPYGRQYERTAYVAKRDGIHTWDGSWTTVEPRQIQVWKTRRGAQKWLSERPGVVANNRGTVEELVWNARWGHWDAAAA